MFVTAFLIAFLFNWIGFLILTCFCHTIAARYGALSGFGLSLAKWTLIVKHNTDLASHENSWLWWLIMAFGFLICVRALVQYVSIKRTWRLLSASAQERLLFFYWKCLIYCAIMHYVLFILMLLSIFIYRFAGKNFVRHWNGQFRTKSLL